MVTPRQPSQDQTTRGAKARKHAISPRAPDDALRALVRLLARQAARDRIAVSSHPADRTHYEEAIHDQA